MSLHRVSSLETFSFRPGQHLQDDGTPRSPSPASGRARKLSFNPLPEEWNPPVDKHASTPGLVAFEVPRWKRRLQIFCAVLYCLFASGIVFGYAAIKPVLKQEGAYRDACKVDNSNPEAIDTCVEIHLNLMFTVAAVGTNVAALPIGTLLDHYGPRVCGLAGACFLTLGALLMGFERNVPFDGLLPGYLFLALGGPFTYISSFQLSNAFPKHSGLILALLTGAFDASSALFLMYRLIFEATSGWLSHNTFFLIYLVVPVIIVLLQLAVMPSQSYKTVGEIMEEAERPIPDARNDDQVDEHTALLQDEFRARKTSLRDTIGGKDVEVAGRQADKEARKNEISGVWGVMHSFGAWEQIRSWWFVLICLFTVIQMTRINYFVATLRAQYTSLLDSSDLAAQLNTFFDVALPLGGILSIPFIGFLLDHLSTTIVLTILVGAATLIGLLGVIPNSMPAAYAGIVLFVLYRPLYYTAVGDYAAKVFGFGTFGTVYGAVICLAGLGNFSQSGLDWVFHSVNKGNPVPVNIGLLVAGGVVGAALVAFVGVQASKLKRQTLEREARDG